MHRCTAIVTTAFLLTAQFCCAPPVRAAAFDKEEPMQCPLQTDECQTTDTQGCSGGPQLVSDFPILKATLHPDDEAVVIVSLDRIFRTDPRIAGGWWSRPTRAIQLRI